MTRVILTGLLSLLVVPFGPAQADRIGPPTTSRKAVEREADIVVLPFEVADKSLAFYGEPVARALAKRLSQATALVVSSLTIAASETKTPRFVIEGSIQPLKKDTIRLEAALRDPIRGKMIATGIRSSTGQLENIEDLVISIAKVFAQRLPQAISEQERYLRQRTTRKPAAPQKPPPRSPKARKRPPLFHVQVAGLDGKLAPLRRAVMRLGKRLRRRVPALQHKTFALDAELLELDTQKHKRAVLSGRGRIRVRVLTKTRQELFGVTLKTGTVVTTGDNRDIDLLRLVCEQGMDIVYPSVLRTLVQTTRAPTTPTQPATP